MGDTLIIIIYIMDILRLQRHKYQVDIRARHRQHLITTRRQLCLDLDILPEYFAT